MSVASLKIGGMEPSEWLAVAGALLEIAGFALVAVELARAQRRELGTAGPFQFLVTVGSWIRLKGRQLFGKREVHEASAVLTGTAKTSGYASGRLGTESKDLGDRLRVLESNFDALDKEVTRHRTELEERINREAEEIRADIRSLRADLVLREKEEREAFKISATLQWWGIGLFVVGVVCSAAANVAN